LANPLVVDHIRFYPHDPQGQGIYSLYQSAKWRENLSPQFRVQMVPVGMKHFYIYEPVTLRNHDQPIVIPVFFYQKDTTLYAKCIKPKYATLSTGLAIYIPKAIEFSHRDLLEIPVSQFDLIYSEIRIRNGDSLMDIAGHQIFGKHSFIISLDIV
jgi:hypothetical protein